MGLFALAREHGTAALAAAILIVGLFRFLRWAIEFGCSRLDISKGDLGKRLKHVETELVATRNALFLLLNHMADRYPADPVLKDVALALRAAWPVDLVRPDPDQDLLDRLGGAHAAAR